MRYRANRVDRLLGGQLELFRMVLDLPATLTAAPGPFAVYLRNIIASQKTEHETSMPSPRPASVRGGGESRTSLFPLFPVRPWRAVGSGARIGQRRRLAVMAGVWTNLCVSALSYEAGVGGEGPAAWASSPLTGTQRRLEGRIYRECVQFLRRAPSLIGSQVARRTLITPFDPLMTAIRAGVFDAVGHAGGYGAAVDLGRPAGSGGPGVVDVDRLNLSFRAATFASVAPSPAAGML
jgi:hypothetical protein